MKKNRYYMSAFVLMSLTLLVGCWDVKEIDKRDIPLIIGIRKENDNQYKVTLYIPITEKGSKLSRTITQKGTNVSSILEQLKTNTEDALYYKQVRLIIIQNNLTKEKEDVSEVIKFLMKSKEIPPVALLAITDENIEKMFSSINEKLDAHATSVIDYFHKGADWAPEISTTRIWEVYRSLFSYTKDIAIPVVNAGKDTLLSFEGSAVLKNGKIIDQISPSENQFVNLFQNQPAKGKVESLGYASIMVKNSSLQIKSSKKADDLMVSSDLSLKIEVLEKKEGATNDQIQRELEKLVEKRFYNLFEQAQKNKTDIFGFGQHFRNQIPYDELKNWREDYYPKLKVNFQVHVKME
ncbi:MULTISPECIES: Ger(x)C family spore germination protein [Paenibacillus]|uniref:Ger(X)C family spore germination protein n=1 Tax=Paenibacillus violae TaxID=3077234 RepID=A0ABU3R9W8_9BACL|nr:MULTISPECIES: Ger(x)C family spore germination protein [Paenibacillus]MDU0201037.1 Ger(x)C family spore germination protein [Paenibacillus sp. PFR10]MEC0264896.1 Ger(x)C family spore germination protein [Paenibacillus anseongense]